MLKVFLFEQHGALHGSRWDLTLLSHILHERVQNVNECDVFVCADITSNQKAKNVEILHAVLTLCGNKPCVVFMPDDPEDGLPLLFPENEQRLVIYRTSLCRVLRAPYEESLPSFACEGMSMLPLVSGSNEMPLVGFCGDIRWPARAASCNILKNDPRFKTRFVYRQGFHMHFDTATQEIYKQEFHDIMSACPYQLCCRGSGNFSHRFYETLAAGRIPVLIDTDICLPSNVPEDAWRQCIVMVQAVHELPDALFAFHNQNDIRQTQQMCRQLWERYLCSKAFAQTIKAKMEKLYKQDLQITVPFPAIESKNYLQAEFGGQDVTKKVPKNGSFIVNNKRFGDPTPDVYKYLHLTKNGETLVVGEEDTMVDVNGYFHCNLAPPMCKSMEPLTDFIHNAKGLEIGGPSMFGVRDTGIYTLPRNLDNLQLLPSLIVSPFELPGKNISGATFAGDVVNVSNVFVPNTFDFTFMSHLLEHLKNPLKALRELWTVLRPNGYCILILSHKENTFNHQRPVTELKELVEHFDNNETEDDIMDHVTPTLLEQYDFTRDPEAGCKDEFIERCRNNFQNRCFHVHVFDHKLIKECFAQTSFKHVYTQLADGHLIVVGQKVI